MASLIYKNVWGDDPTCPIFVESMIPPFSTRRVEPGKVRMFERHLAPVSYTHLDVYKRQLCMCSTASVANIGGSASAPIIACAYHESYAGIGVLMGVLGAALGNFFGLGMGAILHLFV